MLLCSSEHDALQGRCQSQRREITRALSGIRTNRVRSPGRAVRQPDTPARYGSSILSFVAVTFFTVTFFFTTIGSPYCTTPSFTPVTTGGCHTTSV